MAKPSKPAAKKDAGPFAAPVPLSSVRTHCPITGELIRKQQVGEWWIASTSLWTSGPFSLRRDLEWALSHNTGVAPSYQKPGIEVVRDANEPPGSGHPMGE